MDDPRIELPRLGLPVVPVVGGIMLAVGPFLRWVININGRTLQGLDYSPGDALYVLGGLAILVTLLSWENERRQNAAFLIVGALSLALVFHFVYIFQHDIHPTGLGWSDVREGFYVSGVGALLTALAGCPLVRKLVI